MWKRLWDAVRGKMWRALRVMYREVKSCVMVDGEQTEWFETSMGVMLSPILYSIFFNGFAKAMKESGVGSVAWGGVVRG